MSTKRAVVRWILKKAISLLKKVPDWLDWGKGDWKDKF